MEQLEDAPKWPIIVNETLTGSEIYKILQQKGHKLRGKRLNVKQHVNNVEFNVVLLS